MSDDAVTSPNRQSADAGDSCADAGAAAQTDRVALAAFYADAQAAHRRLDLLMNQEAPMDRISVLGRADASGDDPLGIYYSGVGERMRGWGGLGAFWGGIFGLLSGAAGLFVLPGVGAVAAAGPLVSSLVAGAAGAGAGGAVLAGAGAGQQLAVAIHRMGIPESCIDDMQQRLAKGETLVLMIMDPAEAERWRPLLEEPKPGAATPDNGGEGLSQPVAVWTLPFTGVVEAAREQV
ncbi:hypothetical protein CKO31_18385 [Thiohalocapsa halophila]|uniref:DUF1269 domain-containing protein n=1 Tax=Thiohalocapsa halophila TaxID=69359 RepID=A0ABS1CL72_9GAMM|nr:hypothetical protein [Thiohalocapsa halophila]MBK1632675.1 hypothetical protein [Thiohalocapsa halophila]